MYLEIDEGFPGHRKTLRLCAALKNPEAGWFMIRLWTWACRSCPTGDLAGMDPYDIEIAVQYRPLDGACYRAMVTAGFIDEADGKPAAIHNWMERTGGAIAKMAGAAERKKLYRAHRDGKCDPVWCLFCTEAHRGDGSPKDVAGTVPGQSEDKTDPDQSRQDQTSQDKTDPDRKPESSEAQAPREPAPPPLLTFPCTGTGPKTFVVVQSAVDAWSDAFPGVDVLAECKKARAWLMANPPRQKTHRGMERFLVSWFSRQQDRGGAGARGSPTPLRSVRGTAADQDAKAREMFEAGRRWATEGASNAGE